MKKVIPIPARGMCPAVSMCAAGQIVRCKARSDWTSQEEEMVIDSCEDDWGRLHDVTVHGQVSVVSLMNIIHYCGVSV